MMILKKHIFVFIFLIFFYQNSLLNCEEQFNVYQIRPDFLRETKQFFIDIDYTEDIATIYKIWTHTRMSNEFHPDLVGLDTFRPTELFHFGTEEYIIKRREYWARFSEYMIQFIEQGIESYDARVMLFYQTMYNEIGRPLTRNVNIAFSKEDLDNIETRYINSRYLQEFENEFFENSILVLIMFHHTGRTYPKNYEIRNIDGKFNFIVEIWDQYWNFTTLALNYTLFLIKINRNN